VASEIVMSTNLKQRAAVLSRFIQTAERCRILGNYNGTMEIISALQLSSIHHLKRTWKEISTKDVETFNELSKLMGMNENYKLYREELAQKEKDKTPVVPYAGIFLQDFLIIEELPDKTATGLINFQKMRRIGAMISRLKRYQSSIYNFHTIPVIQEYLRIGLTILSEKDISKWAKICEAPRNSPSQPATSLENSIKDKEQKKEI